MSCHCCSLVRAYKTTGSAFEAKIKDSGFGALEGSLAFSASVEVVKTLGCQL
jgi:hypothetical protein